MKNIILLTLLLILSGLTYYLYKTNYGSTMKRELSDFAVEDTASINKIFLTDKNNRSSLLERRGQVWFVNGKYEARQDVVKTLLETIRNVTVKAPVPRPAFKNIIKLLAGRAVKVEIYQGQETPSKVYYVGHPNQEQTGTYMLMEGSSVPFLTHIEGFRGFLSTRYFTNEMEWRSTKLFSYDLGDIASIRVENFKKPQSNFEIQIKNGHDYKLFSYPSYQEQSFDTAKLLLYTALYKKVHFEFFDYLKSKHDQDSIRTHTPPEYRYTVTDIHGKTNTITTYLKSVQSTSTDYEGNPITHDIDRFYGYVNNDYMVIAQYFVFDPLTKGIQDFK